MREPSLCCLEKGALGKATLCVRWTSSLPSPQTSPNLFRVKGTLKFGIYPDQEEQRDSIRKQKEKSSKPKIPLICLFRPG